MKAIRGELFFCALGVIGALLASYYLDLWTANLLGLWYLSVCGAYLFGRYWPYRSWNPRPGEW